MKERRHQGFSDIEKGNLLDHETEIEAYGRDPARLEKGQETIGWGQGQGEIG